MTETRQYVIENRTVITLVVDDPALTFNEYIRHRTLTGNPINGDREAFYAYLPHFAQGHRWSLECWWQWWDRFVQSQDARDLHETQADVIASSYPL